MTFKATLGGVPLPTDQELAWSYTRGPQPHIRSFELEAAAASRLEQTMGQQITLFVEHGAADGTDLVVNHLYVIAAGPPSAAKDGTPGRRRVEVADRRVWWSGGHIPSAYNVRRFGDTKTLVGERVETAAIKPESKYAAYSIRNETTAWTAREVLEDILGQIGSSDVDLSASAGYHIRDTLPEVEIEDLSLADDFGSALSRLMAFMPGMTFHIDKDGRIVIENRRLDLPTAGGTRVRGTKEPGPLGVELWSSGTFTQKGNRAALRPREIRVHITPEVEVKWGFDESGSEAEDAFSLQNVLPSPDPELTVDGEVMGQSSWIKFDPAITAWAADTVHAWPSKPTSQFPVSQATIRANFLSRMYEAMSYVQSLSVNNPDPILLGRISAILGHWRSTMRINPYWWGRIESVRPVRAAVIDRGTGQRAPSPVYGNHTVRPSFRGVVNAQTNRSGKPMPFAVTSYSGSLAGATAAPARVSILDKDVGVFHWELRNDPWGWAESISWGLPKGDDLPHQSIAEFNRRGVQALATLRYVELDSTFKAATILTVVPGAPNTLDRFHTETVTPDEAQAVMGGAEVGQSLGPPMDIRILPSVMTARYAWTDAAEGQIKDVMKNGGQLPLDNLVNEEHVRNVAVAAAAAVYEGMLDLTEGKSVDVSMNPALSPVGPVEAVTHGLQQTRFGAATVTRAEIPRISKPGSMWKFMPPATRKEALRIREGI